MAEAAQRDDDVLEVVVGDDAQDDNTADDGAEPALRQDSPEAIRVAALMGWKPKDAWKGEPENWRGAEEFLAQVPEVLANTRKANESTKGKLTRIIAQVAKLEETQQGANEREAIAALTAAVEAGDTEAAVKIAQSLKAKPSEPAEFADFKSRNSSWWGADPVATALAQTLDAQYAPGGKVDDLEAHFRKIEAGVRKTFPALFEGERKERPAAPIVNRGSRVANRQSNGEKTVADLTSAERAAAKEMGVTPESYVKSYNKVNAR